jgi:hypothetical protein
MMQFLRFVSLILLTSITLNAFSQHSVNGLLINSNDVFVTTIDVYGKSIDGLTIFDVKDSATVRVLFTTIGGPKLLDLEMTPTSYKVNYAIKKLNKKVILKALYEDFATISGLYLMLPISAVSDEEGDSILYKHQTFNISKNKDVCYIASSGEYHSAKMKGKKKTLFDIVYFYEGYSLQTIVLTHHNFNMKITLTKLKGEAIANESQ